MEYRVLPGTDLELSAVTFGTIWFAAASGREHIDTEEGKRALNLALDEGVNVIHSSYEYRTRYAVLEALKESKRTRQVRHIIKVPSPDKGKAPTWSPEYMIGLVEDALRELDADRIDVLQWILRDGHEDDAERSIATFNEIKDDVKATFDKLRDQGKAGYLGFFGYTNEFAQAAARSGIFNTMQFYYNIWDTCLLPSFDVLRENNVSVMPFRPFQGGLLTEKRRDISKLPEDDKMNNEGGRKRLETRDQLLLNAGIDPEDLTRFAMKFCLAPDLVTTIITGMNNCEQVRQTLGAVDGDYPSLELAQTVHEEAKKLGGPWTT